MSIFSLIKSAIFGASSGKPVAAQAPQAQAAAPAASAPAPATAAAATAQTGGPPAVAPPVDVEAVLTVKAKDAPEKLNWRQSIVDLMKLLGLDSSLKARTELAHELGYTGDTQDSAAMNIWLHKQVMKKLADNGGKVPADLLH